MVKLKPGFPDLEEVCGAVVGKGKEPFVGGVEIPTTKVEVVRPQAGGQNKIMSISEKEKIDIVAIDPVTDDVILTITDHLDWQDEKFHLEALQNKLNSYIEFIDGGQIFVDYPKSNGKNLIIEIVSMYEYNQEGINYIERVRPTLNSIDVEIRLRIHKD